MKDLCVWFTAFVLTLTWGAFHGALSAMAASIVLMVLEVSEPNMTVLTREGSSGGRWRSSENIAQAAKEAGILVVRMEGPLFYANVQSFQERI